MTTATEPTTQTPAHEQQQQEPPKTRRKNLVTIELTPEGQALAVLLQTTEEELVEVAVKAHVAAMTAKLRDLVVEKKPF